MRNGSEIGNGKRIGYTLAGMLLTVCGGVVGDTGSGKEYRDAYSSAFTSMTSGDAYGGAVTLIEGLRACPGDDAKIADELVGHAQLLAFAVVSLMDWPERDKLRHDILDTEKSLFDQLLVAALEAGSGTPNLALPAFARLDKLTRCDHQAVRVTALYLLADPYYFGKSPSYNRCVSELVLGYPELDLSRHVIEMPVWQTLKKVREGKSQPTGYLFNGIIYAGGRQEPVVAVSPALRKMAERLPSLRAGDITDAMVAQWAGDAVSMDDPQATYGLLCLLSSVEMSPARREAVLPALETLAAGGEKTSAAVRARIMLATFARDEHRTGDVRERLDGLLPRGPLPCTPERSLYEATMQAVQHAAKYLTRYGDVAGAIAAHEALATRYPGTALGETEEIALRDLRERGLGVCVEEFKDSLRAPRRNKDWASAREICEEVRAFAVNKALAAAASFELESIAREEAAASAPAEKE